MKGKSKYTKAPCGSCHNLTNHTREGSFCRTDHEFDQDDTPIYSWETEYQLLRCCGCDTGSLRILTAHPYSEAEYEYHPPPVVRRVPAWYRRLPASFRSLLIEVYRALDARHRRLCMMGARALLDMSMVKAVGDVGSFRDKLTALRGADRITRRQEKLLVAALDAGHAAAHRGFEPSEEVMNGVLEILENLLQSQFVLEERSKVVARATPRRRSKPRRGTT